MNFIALDVEGLVRIEPERHEDERGWFTRTWCASEFAAAGLPAVWAQTSTSFNRRRGTLRGLHFQHSPYGETKLVRCTSGAVFDVAVDVRPRSPTFGRWTAVVLSRANGHALFIPAGFAHGFLTLEDETELLYNIDAPYVAQAARGVRWDDPKVGIDWPFAPLCLSPRDAELPLLADLDLE